MGGEGQGMLRDCENAHEKHQETDASERKKKKFTEGHN